MIRFKYSWQSAFMGQHEQALTHPWEKGISMTLNCSHSVLPKMPVQYSWVPPHYSQGCPASLCLHIALKGGGGYLQYLALILHLTNFHYTTSTTFYRCPLCWIILVENFPVSSWNISCDLLHLEWSFSEILPRHHWALFQLFSHKILMPAVQ